LSIEDVIPEPSMQNVIARVAANGVGEVIAKYGYVGGTQ
jgi:hypothetical protein